MVKLPLDCRAEYIEPLLSPLEIRDIYRYLDGSEELKDRRLMFANGSEHVIDTGRYMLANSVQLGFEQPPDVWGGRSAWGRPAWSLSNAVSSRRRVPSLQCAGTTKAARSRQTSTPIIRHTQPWT